MADSRIVRNNLLERYINSQGGEGFEGKGKKTLSTEPLHTALIANLPSGMVPGDIDMFRDLEVRDDIFISMEDLRSAAERSAEVAEDIFADEEKDIERAYRAVDNAKNVAEMKRKFSNKLKENIRKFERDDIIWYNMLSTAECSADIAEANYLDKKKYIECAWRAVGNAKSIAKLKRKYASSIK